jgi:hypothetical protein
MDQKAVVRGEELRLDTLIQGLETSLPSAVTSLIVDGVSYTIPALVKKAQSIADPYKQAREAHAALRQLALTRDADHKAAATFLADMKPVLEGLLGRTSVDLAKFGFKPQSPRKQLTPEQKVVRAQKAAATRAARHTMGARQKAEIRSKDPLTVMIGPDGSVSASTTPTNGSKPAPVAQPGTPSPAATRVPA